MVYATPKKIKTVDLEIEAKPWSSNIKIYEDSVVSGKFYWADTNGTNDAMIAYADGTSETITKNIVDGTSFSAGIVYFYHIQGNPALQTTTDYGSAVGAGKNLIAVIDVKTNRPSTIQQFNSYTPTIGAGGIAAKSIRSEHLITDVAVITNSLQLQGGIITSDHIIEILAEKIKISGEVYLTAWRGDGKAPRK
jgi:hypothetical protein